MKTSWAVILGVLVGGIFHWHGLQAGDRNAVPRAELADQVERYIASCDAKGALKDSRSENLQNAAAVATMQAAYARAYRERLVDEMLAEGVAPKDYQVKAHINHCFYETVRARTIASR
jgi:hypothetical protein